MARFRRRIVIAAAEQWHPDRDVAGVVFSPDHPDEHRFTNADGITGNYIVYTQQGQRAIAPGDWIVTEPNGTRYVYSPAEMAASFERVA